MTSHRSDLSQAFRAWLDAVEKPAGLRNYGATPTATDVTAGRAWQRVLSDAGWACIAWPAEHGGRAASVVDQVAFAEECARADVPRQLNIVGPDLVGPVLIAHATDEQRAKWLTGIRTGSDLWCQLFSEPDAGSDLAALRTHASQAEGGWVVTGRKVWTSAAMSADLGLLLARTGPARFDLSLFVLDMSAEGVEVRPIRQMDGEAKFNEVVLDDVHVDAEALVGPLGDGWRLAVSTLGMERLTLGAQAVALGIRLEELRDRELGPGVRRQAFARLWSRVWLLAKDFDRLLTAGHTLADPRFSMLKLAATELQRDLSRFAVQCQGMPVVAADGARHPAAAHFLSQPGQTIAGGTSEIQRNILAERVLGLPR